DGAAQAQNAAFSPGRAHGVDTSPPVGEHVTYALRRSSPPKQTFVTIGSGNGTCSEPLPSGAITVSPPFTSVPTTTLPSPSTANESKSCMWGRPQISWPPLPTGGGGAASSPGPARSQANTRPVNVSAA